jgi:hypothetical protein
VRLDKALRAGDRRRTALNREPLVSGTSISHLVQTSRTPLSMVALSQAWMTSPSS